MDQTKKILNVAIAFSIVILSLSVFIYSIRDSKAIAKPEADKDGYVVAGTAFGRINNSMVSTQYKQGYLVLGYNPKTGHMKVLATREEADLFK